MDSPSLNEPSDDLPLEADSPKEVEAEAPQRGEPKRSAAFEEFAKKLGELPTPEEKIAEALIFMRTSVSQEGTPHFREFWEVRRLVLPIFKENLNAIARAKLWAEYVELTVEARRLKEILEEQSAFAIEQIDLAVKALETDAQGFDALLATVQEIPFPQESLAIQDKRDSYNLIQRELNLLNNLASRLSGLRKEVLKTDMRIRFKTKFFKRLSDLGDQIFPQRKKLIEEISSQFEKDVERFVENYFKNGEAAGAPYYALREEIKTLQGMAKVFTLSSGAFSRTRLKLSECWDQIKVLEKEHKKVYHEKRQASSVERQGIQAKIEELKTRSADMPQNVLEDEIEKISQEMRQVDLQREDVRGLRDELHKLRLPYIEERERRARELEEAEKAKLLQRREKAQKLGEKIATLLKEGLSLELDQLLQTFDEIVKEIEQLEISKLEKQQFQRQLRPLKDLISEKKEQSLLNLSDDDKKTLENLRTVLQQKKERRQEIKAQLDIHRKALGGSGLDFEKAMQLNEMIDGERELLEKANAGIAEIEARIDALEG